jgi:hypothetical protein
MRHSSSSTRTIFLLLVLVWAGYAQPAVAQSYPHALISASCAPWDGPAVSLVLTTKPTSCGKAPEGPYLSIYIWRDLPEHGPKTIEFKEAGGNGGASRCATANECERATSGRLTFTKFDQNGEVEGSYEFHFKDGSVEQGSFKAEWCHERVVCG